MKICVFGLWHLGSVTAACLADAGFETLGLDPDSKTIESLRAGKPPLFEPGLEDLVGAGLASKHLSFSDDIARVAEADVVWITFDTPVDDEDRADVAYVADQIASLFPHLANGAVVLVSSQMPVGSVAELECRFAEGSGDSKVIFACSPENLRLGKAIEVFQNPERIIVGLRDGAGKAVISELLAPFGDTVLWMDRESAEISKHALNAYLASNITFMNEVAMVCEKTGADVKSVERALRSEPRVGPNAYIRPGGAFAGGTLARDVTFLSELAHAKALPLEMISAILDSNRFHSGWTQRRVCDVLGDLAGRRIAVLGLTYKPGTDTLRRSLSVGAVVTAFDPAVAQFPDAPDSLSLAASAIEALKGAEAVLVMTEWPEFRSLGAEELIVQMAKPVIFDQNGFLDHLAEDDGIIYITVGRVAGGK
jgi:UDPglucose 6-dehydrogenase